MGLFRIKYKVNGYSGQMTIDHWSHINAVALVQKRVRDHLAAIEPYVIWPTVDAYVLTNDGRFISWDSEEATQKGVFDQSYKNFS